jgi:acyl-CoA ligase (AMP-forming) (exosortase A-associated)
MPKFLAHELIYDTARRFPDRPALTFRDDRLTYRDLATAVASVANGLIGYGAARRDRIAVYLDKRPETVIALFGAAAAGGAFVPINPVLRPHQVAHIMRDCNVRILVTNADRLASLADGLGDCPDLETIVLVDGAAGTAGRCRVIEWAALAATATSLNPRPRMIDTDMAAILYTSGSTGSPKGVVLSHRNLVVGAESVSQYLENDELDRILSVLPLSFDAGLSQLTTAFNVGAELVLMNYLLARDVARACARHDITGLTCVAPLWIQLAQIDWSEGGRSIRYFANTGGHMPRQTLQQLRTALPAAKPYLMYGLTEAFRSTYLDPAEVDNRPDSIGKAIPNAEIMVVRPDGTPCNPDEEGELVHRGALVSLGYWNDPERTAIRFKPAPGQPPELPNPELAVWSGDVVRKDAEGFIYFVGRNDEMIKTSGYRVSPTEIEEVVYASGLIGEAVALGIAHPSLGQAIAVVATGRDGAELDSEALLAHCRRELPKYMVPEALIPHAGLPRSPNGKIDRKQIEREISGLFQKAVS